MEMTPMTDQAPQTVPPADDPDRAPDLLLEDPVGRTIIEIGKLIAAGSDDAGFSQRLSAAIVDGRVDPSKLTLALVLILDRLVKHIGPDGELDSADALCKRIIAPIAVAIRATSTPQPVWLVPARSIDVSAAFEGAPVTLEDAVRMSLALIGLDVMQLVRTAVGAADRDADGGAIDGDGVDGDAREVEDGGALSSHGVRLLGLGEALASASRARVTGPPDGAFGDPVALGLGSGTEIAAAVMMIWATEYMDSTIPGLSRRFIDHVLHTRIPRGDLDPVSAIWPNTAHTTTPVGRSAHGVQGTHASEAASAVTAEYPATAIDPTNSATTEEDAA